MGACSKLGEFPLPHWRLCRHFDLNAADRNLRQPFSVTALFLSTWVTAINQNLCAWPCPCCPWFLFFYLAGQLVSGVVMFEIMLGLNAEWALGITTLVLLFYVVLGGAHADILTDGFQGALMLVLAVLVIVLTLVGYGIDGGLFALVDNLEAQDPNLATALNPSTPLYHSWWSIFVIAFAHMPLGLLPHLGNKLWALDSTRDRFQFVKLAALFGLMLGMLGLGGLLARAYFGDALYAEGANPNQALPLLFIEIFPTWLAALIGIGVLSAVMSTADGLVVSSLSNHCK